VHLLQTIFQPLKRTRVVFRALRHRNYRLFFLGQGVSLIGTWMQRIALSWLVYRLTNSEWLLGVVGFSSQILTFVLAPFAGVLADRTNRKQLIVVTQAVAMVQAFVLAFLTLSHTINVWEIIALSAVLGMVNAFDIPIRQAFVVEMLETRDDLPNAIALNSFLVNGAKLVGPSVAGALIAIVGEGMCFVFNGISFVAVIAALIAMRVKNEPLSQSSRNVIEHLKEGIAYVAVIRPMRSILLLLASVSLVGLSVVVLMPVFAKDVLHGGPHTLGFLMAVSGLGAIGGAAFLAARNEVNGLDRLITYATGLLGVTLIGLAFSRSLPWALVSVGAMGFATMVLLASCNTFLQSRVDDHMRGRVMSFYTVAFMGMAPFGNLLSGGIAASIGAEQTATAGGVACIVAALVYWAHRTRRGSMTATPT
jgi:MFS family permease